MTDDRIAKESAGRYFPLQHVELVAAIKVRTFSTHTPGHRLQVMLESARSTCDRGYQLCTFFPQSYIAAFSLPEVVPLQIGTKAMKHALDQFALIDRQPAPTLNRQQFVIYRAFLDSPQALSITRHIVNGVDHSYLQFRKVAQLSRAEQSTKGQTELARVQLV